MESRGLGIPVDAQGGELLSFFLKEVVMNRSKALSITMVCALLLLAGGTSTAFAAATHAIPAVANAKGTLRLGTGQINFQVVAQQYPDDVYLNYPSFHIPRGQFIVFTTGTAAPEVLIGHTIDSLKIVDATHATITGEGTTRSGITVEVTFQLTLPDSKNKFGTCGILATNKSTGAVVFTSNGVLPLATNSGSVSFRPAFYF
jgi:hypothetical protein